LTPTWSVVSWGSAKPSESAKPSGNGNGNGSENENENGTSKETSGRHESTRRSSYGAPPWRAHCARPMDGESESESGSEISRHDDGAISRHGGRAISRIGGERPA